VLPFQSFNSPCKIIQISLAHGTKAILGHSITPFLFRLC